MLRVGIDVQPLVGTGGIATYTRALLEHMTGVHLVPVFGGLRGAEAVAERLPTHLQGALRIEPLALRAADRFARLAGMRFRVSGGGAGIPGSGPGAPGGGREEAAGGSMDLVHGTNYLAPAYRLPAVVTVHDLTALRHPEWHSAETRRHRRFVPGEVRRARCVIADSEYTARDAETLLGVPRSRIRVVHLAPSPLPPPDPEALDRLGIGSGPFVLFVGALEPRKNVPRLIRAFFDCPAAAGHRLVLAGPLAWGAREVFGAAMDSATGSRGAATRSREVGAGPRVVITGPVPAAALAALYDAAACFAFPSLGEGFGLPPLEAMAAGVPVLASNRGSLAEVLGDAAVVVDPEDCADISRGLGRLLADRDFAGEMRQRGLERAARFTWGKTAELTRHAYEDALS